MFPNCVYDGSFKIPLFVFLDTHAKKRVHALLGSKITFHFQLFLSPSLLLHTLVATIICRCSLNFMGLNHRLG